MPLPERNDMKRYDLIVVGAGPSGLSAAIEASKRGVKTIVFDENARPGGQLFKQIHKFAFPVFSYDFSKCAHSQLAEHRVIAGIIGAFPASINSLILAATE